MEMEPMLIWSMCAFMVAATTALLVDDMVRSLHMPYDTAEHPGPEDLSVTVVVPARNAAETLVPLLQDLYAQDLERERVEVLVVDDGSTDGSAGIVERMMAQWPGLRYMRSPGEGKKAAIAAGVEAARGQLIVQTDADVRMGSRRLSAVLREFGAGYSGLLLMPVATEGDGLLGGLQADEQAALLVVGAAQMREGRGVLGFGANMAYLREAFLAVGGFHGDRQASGDDLRLVLRMRRAGYSVRYLLHKDVLVRTAAMPDLRSAWAQRLRWAGKMHRQPLRFTAAPAAALLYPWLLSGLTLQLLRTLQQGEDLFYALFFLAGAWACWLNALGGLVRAGRALVDVPAGRITWPWALLFPVYGLLVALQSIVYRPKWKGRRT